MSDDQNQNNQAELDAAALAQYRQASSENPFVAADFRRLHGHAIERALDAEAAKALPAPEPDEKALLVQAERAKQEQAQEQAFNELKSQYEALKAVNPIMAARFGLANRIWER